MSGTHVPEGPKILVLTLLYKDNLFSGADFSAIPFRTVRSHLGIDVFVFSRGIKSTMSRLSHSFRILSSQWGVYAGFRPTSTMSISRRNSPMSGEFASSSSLGEVLMKRVFTNFV